MYYTTTNSVVIPQARRSSAQDAQVQDAEQQKGDKEGDQKSLERKKRMYQGLLKFIIMSAKKYKYILCRNMLSK